MKILIFIILKVLEIGAIVFVPYWIGKRTPFKAWGFDYNTSSLYSKWIGGVAIIVLLILTFIFLLAFLLTGYFVGTKILPVLVNLNWQLAESILSKF